MGLGGLYAQKLIVAMIYPDRTWSLLEPHLPGRKGSWGGLAKRQSAFSSMLYSGSCAQVRPGVIFPLILATGATRTAALSVGAIRAYGRLLEVLIEEPDYEWLIIDASHCKVHPHAAGARGGNQEMSATKGGSTPRYIWPWMRLVCRSERILHMVPELTARRLADLSKD